MKTYSLNPSIFNSIKPLLNQAIFFRGEGGNILVRPCFRGARELIETVSKGREDCYVVED